MNMFKDDPAFQRLIAERKRDREDVMEEARMLEQYRNLLF